MPDRAPPPPRLLTRTFGLLVSAHFLAALGWSSALLLPLYLAHLGASRTEIGSLMAAAAIGGLASRPAVGWALDRLGRKPVLMAATLLQALGMVMVAAIRRVGAFAYAQRIVFGVGGGSILAGYFTLAPDLVPEARRTEGIALFGISGLLPLVVNPLVQRLGVDGAQLRWYFPGLALVSLLSLAALAKLPETRPVAGDDGGQPRGVAATRRALLSKALAPVWVATVVFAAMVSVFMAFVTVAAERRGIADPAAVWLSYAAGAAAIRLIGARLPDRVGPENVVTPAVAIYAAAALVAAQARSALGFLVAGALGGVGHGYSFPVLTSQVASRCPLHLRGAGVATFTALWDAARLSITPLFGALADSLGDAAMFAALALWAVAGLIVWTALERRL